MISLSLNAGKLTSRIQDIKWFRPITVQLYGTPCRSKICV
jgi:hypothetical protein